MGIYALDCEMVKKGSNSILARVSIVNHMKVVVLDLFLKSEKPVSGIRADDLAHGTNFDLVRGRVEKLLSGHAVCGHSLMNHLAALNLTSLNVELMEFTDYVKFQNPNGVPISLKELARWHLGIHIQQSGHDSVEGAQACMDIYKKYASQLS